MRSSRPLSSGFGDASADRSSSCSCSATLSPAGSAAAKPASKSPATASKSPATASESPAAASESTVAASESPATASESPAAASATGDAGRGEGATSPPGISKWSEKFSYLLGHEIEFKYLDLQYSKWEPWGLKASSVAWMFFMEA